MGKPAARLGDPTAHGGVIVLGFPMVLIGGMPAARIGDMHVCPMLNPGVPPPPHVGGPISLGSPMVLIGGMPAARMGDMVVCAGPPDTIIMGCPTVLIGEGGSGSASGGGAGGGAGTTGTVTEKNTNTEDIAIKVLSTMAEGALSNPVAAVMDAFTQMASAAATAIAASAHALSGNTESSTKEGHWIEFEFVDKAGNPVSGIEYELTHPDKNESGGRLNSDGKIKRDAQASGEGKAILKNLFNAKWSEELVKPGDKVKLSAEADGFADGSPVEIKIYRKNINGSENNIKTLEEKIKAKKIEVELENNFESAESDEQEKYTSAGYYFEVVSGQCKTRSDMLFIEDFIELEVKDSEGNPLPNEDFVLFLPNGKVETGKLDSNGYKKIEKIPAGKYSVKFPNLVKKEIN